jgi:hypothetical protein
MSFIAPDACTLPTAEQPLRVAEFDALFATALRGVEQPEPTRARFLFTDEPGLAHTVRNLTAREAECCSFFAFTITEEPLLLEVEVPSRYADVLAALVGRARVA